jgi:hypothetical protein
MFRKLIRATVCVAALLIAAPAVMAAPKVPTTAEEHFALAKQYQEQATARRKEAQEHREMAEAFKKSAVDARKGYGQRNPQVVKMEKHCQAIATAADKLATEDEKAADFHTLRGKELQGK